MSSAFAAVALLCLLGAPAVLAVDRSVSPGTLLGLSFLLGAGLASSILLCLSLAGIAWSSASFAAAALPLAALLVWLAVRRWRSASPRPASQARGKFSAASVALDLLTLIAVVGHGIYATLAPLGQWDFWADWGLKARVFWIHRGVDWAFLASPENYFAHRDYPPLLPLTLDFFSIIRGGWEDRWIGLLFTAFAAALLLVARDLLRQELRSPPLASLATLAVAGPALVIWIGLAEGPLIAYGSLSLLLLRRALQGERASSTFGALLLGFATLTKNEGIALLISVALAMALVKAGRGSHLLRLWPAAALSAFWLLPRWAHGLSSELLGGPVGPRILSRVLLPGPFLAALREGRWPQPLVWIAAVGTFLLWRRSLAKEKFVLAAVGLQIFFSLLIYAASPHPLPWHVRNSLERLLAQQTFPLAFVAATLLLYGLRQPEPPFRPAT